MFGNNPRFKRYKNPHYFILAPRRTYTSDNKAIIGPDIGLTPVQHQAIIWTISGLFLTRSFGKHFSDALHENDTVFMYENEFGNVVMKMALILFRPQYVKETLANMD